jgi:hypothetical protein
LITVFLPKSARLFYMTAHVILQNNLENKLFCQRGDPFLPMTKRLPVRDIHIRQQHTYQKRLFFRGFRDR